MSMFNGTALMIDAFVERLEREYSRNYGTFAPQYGEILGWAGRMALERISQTDALYHHVEHTIMVTLVGQEILRGRHIRQGGVTPSDWLHFMISLLCHDIGYVRGVCRADRGDVCSTGRGDQVVTSGGLIGKVTKVADNEVEVELAPNVKVRVVRSTISQVVSKTEPAEA